MFFTGIFVFWSEKSQKTRKTGLFSINVPDIPAVFYVLGIVFFNFVPWFF